MCLGVAATGACGVGRSRVYQKLKDTPLSIFLGAPTLVDCRERGEVIVPFQPVWFTWLVRFCTPALMVYPP